MGVPVLLGHLGGDVPAGLIATLGAFTSLYGNDRPYRNRAIHLLAVALALTLSVMLGVWARNIPLAVIPAVVLIAMTSTFLCNALRVAPPGAYMFALACAAGTGMPIRHLPLLQVGLLVLGGGLFAWLVSMAGVFLRPRGPEQSAVRAATQATARLIKSIGTPGEDVARHAAALALQQAWTVLVTWQPARPRPNSTLHQLRTLNRELHLLFANIMNSRATESSALAAASRAIEDIAARLRKTADRREPTEAGHIPPGHYRLLESLRENLRPWSPALLATARVGVAATVAGTLGFMLDLERAYWAVAATVLILHQGLDWLRSLQRAIDRTLGTFVGLGLAGAILTIAPDGLWLVATLMLLQFTIEIFVMRNYALAVVFVTAAAMTIASVADPFHSPGWLLWARGVDTLIGCLTGLLILTLTSPRSVENRIPRELVGTLVSIKRVLVLAATGELTTNAAWKARRDLQHRTIVLQQAYEAAMGATPWHRSAAERSWPTVSAAQRLSYRVLSFCWSLESLTDDQRIVAAREAFGTDGPRRIGRALLQLAKAIRRDSKPAPLAPLPEFLDTDVRNLHDSLVFASGEA